MIGELLAILAAICWAVSAVTYRTVLSRVSYFVVNLLRSVFAALFLFAVLMLTSGGMPSVNLSDLGILSFAAIINLAIGDSLFFIGLAKIGISRTQPIASAYPLFSLILVIVVLGERPTLPMIVGTPLIVAGIIMISAHDDSISKFAKRHRVGSLGTLWALGAAVCYSIGIVIYKLVLGGPHMGVVLASFVRPLVIIPFLASIVMVLAPSQIKKLTRKDLLTIGVAGVIDMGIGGLLLLGSLSLIDASKAIPLSSTTPLFALIFASQLSSEKILIRVIVATILIVTGTILVTSTGSW